MIIHTFDTRKGPIVIDSLKVSLNRILATASDKLQAEFVPITGELGQLQRVFTEDFKLYLRQYSEELNYAINKFTGDIDQNIKLLFEDRKIFDDMIRNHSQRCLDVLGHRNNIDRFLVTVNDEDDLTLTKLCKTHFPWGFCDDCTAIVYAPDKKRKLVQLHECLHLFKVKDCYDEETKKPKVSCNNENCLMRYDVISKEVCGEVICQLKTFAEKHFADHTEK